MNVFVAATPISGPARVSRMPSTSRAKLLPPTLQMATVCDPCCRATRAAASVSAVSPLCEISTTSGRAESIPPTFCTGGE